MEQTNRTILFEEVNPNKKDIFSFMGDENQESLSDDCIDAINRDLVVSSFEEFIQKFAPSVYICIDINEKTVFCTSAIEEVNYFSSGKRVSVCQIKFDENNRMLQFFIDMLDGKNSGQLDEDVLDNMISLLNPELNEDDFFIEFANIINCFARGSNNKLDCVFYPFAYKYNNFLFLIRMLLKLYSKELTMKESQRKMKNFCINRNESSSQISVEAIAIEYKKQYTYLTPQNISLYDEWIQGDFFKQDGSEWLYIIFELLSLIAKGEMDAMQDMFYSYSKLYSEILEKLWICSKLIIEKFIGVKAFFSQNKCKGNSAQLLVTNTTIQNVNDIRYKSRLQIYFDTVNTKLYNKNTIWYAIIPRLPYLDEIKRENIRERFSGSKHDYMADTQDFEGYLEIANMLARNKIQVFCSPASSEHTRAEWVYDNGVEEWIDYHKNLSKRDYAEYIYPCFPNVAFFTDKYLKVGEQNKIWLQMPCVEASYIAAGMFAAFQNSQYLKTYFPNMVDESTPGVGFRIMSDNNNLKISSSLKASVFLYSDEIMDYISRKICGIFFAPFGSEMIIVQDRSLAGLYGKNNCVSQIQTMTYLERIICKETQDFKSSLIEQFFQRRPNSISAKWNQNKSYVNSVLKKDEQLLFKLDKENKECVFEFVFSNALCQTKVHTN